MHVSDLTRVGRRWAVVVLALLVVAVPASAMPTIDTAARHAILIDTTTGAVLLEKDADVPIPPASMSKIMTAFMVFERLEEGRLTLDDVLAVSVNAWRRGGAASGGSTMFLDPNSQARVEDLLRGVIIQSGNDASIVLAEGLAGSEAGFAAEMTVRGRELGLTHSSFRNATGLPDPDHRMSARDIARVAQRIIEDFPQYYPFYSETEFTYNGIRQGNRNPLLYRNIGADGLKTGFTRESGYGLAASAMQGDRRLILVVNGLESLRQRTQETERLMAWGFREFDNYQLAAEGEAIAEAEVWLGTSRTVPLVGAHGLVVTLPRAARPEMTVTVRYDGPIPAPIEKGQHIGTLVVSAPDVPSAEVPLVAGESVERLGLMRRLFAALTHFIMSQIS
ncbi:MAG: D-alanyl-D-alanine carboxypeptidase [Rhodospirillales bacterium]|nr:MAG: D-alanyl-D-alanine carboxypeptidase [Rhodospirillales bacterium]